MMEKYKEFLFAPDEVPGFLTKPKDNFFGIGYSGLERPTLFTGPGSSVSSEDKLGLKWSENSRKLKITGQAFGVGAYEEEDDDIYNRNDMGQYDLSLDVSDKKERRRDKASRWGEAKALTDLTDGVADSP